MRVHASACVCERVHAAHILRAMRLSTTQRARHAASFAYRNTLVARRCRGVFRHCRISSGGELVTSRESMPKIQKGGDVRDRVGRECARSIPLGLSARTHDNGKAGESQRRKATKLQREPTTNISVTSPPSSHMCSSPSGAASLSRHAGRVTETTSRNGPLAVHTP